jgi:hypothetical protein
VWPLAALLTLHFVTGLTGETGCEVDLDCSFGDPRRFWNSRDGCPDRSPVDASST